MEPRVKPLTGVLRFPIPRVRSGGVSVERHARIRNTLSLHNWGDASCSDAALAVNGALTSAAMPAKTSAAESSCNFIGKISRSILFGNAETLLQRCFDDGDVFIHGAAADADAANHLTFTH